MFSHSWLCFEVCSLNPFFFFLSFPKNFIFLFYVPDSQSNTDKQPTQIFQKLCHLNTTTFIKWIYSLRNNCQQLRLISNRKTEPKEKWDTDHTIITTSSFVLPEGKTEMRAKMQPKQKRLSSAFHVKDS